MAGVEHVVGMFRGLDQRLTSQIYHVRHFPEIAKTVAAISLID